MIQCRYRLVISLSTHRPIICYLSIVFTWHLKYRASNLQFWLDGIFLLSNKLSSILTYNIRTKGSLNGFFPDFIVHRLFYDFFQDSSTANFKTVLLANQSNPWTGRWTNLSKWNVTLKSLLVPLSTKSNSSFVCYSWTVFTRHAPICLLSNTRMRLRYVHTKRLRHRSTYCNERVV